MKVLCVHPSGLMYTEVYLRLEPLGLERVAGACRKAGHEVRLLDLQVFKHKHYQSVLRTWRPDAVAFSLRPASPRARSWPTPTARSTA